MVSDTDRETEARRKQSVQGSSWVIFFSVGHGFRQGNVVLIFLPEQDGKTQLADSAPQEATPEPCATFDIPIASVQDTYPRRLARKCFGNCRSRSRNATTLF